MNCLRFFLEIRLQYRLNLGQSSQEIAAEFRLLIDLNRVAVSDKISDRQQLPEGIGSEAFAGYTVNSSLSLMLTISEICQRDRQPSGPIHGKNDLKVAVLVS